MGDEKLLLTLEIAGRRYPLKIELSEEQAFREAAKKINSKINQYRVAYGGGNSNLTTQDFMAMTAIQALAENFSLGDKNNTKPFEDKIDSLINELDNYLRK
ncbi:MULTISPECIES: cell division protein ZapA [Proteiniphilum]|jgi:cell division protein ZapA|uniref:cell division protein ZapA n=1 Tax=Proteiniphilum TaxID=294702 RepID=UPI001EEA4BC4|nr:MULTISPECIES: cell division protein ZapA [Proteiniphilum]MDD2245910.1 cell division protein ZapA [Proteiniphilum sp.]MDD3908511.1 cell division protein ZapA [Proteiniphilum sp.]MDD4415538.1 cell division protein ZapA [Proteiniphilum sp.]ULB33154.1 cell division protein ZapA [Proteiniphilum propionicum]